MQIQDNGWASVGHAEGRHWEMNAGDLSDASKCMHSQVLHGDKILCSEQANRWPYSACAFSLMHVDSFREVQGAVLQSMINLVTVPSSMLQMIS